MNTEEIIRKAEEDEWIEITQFVKLAVLQEREACAKVIEECNWPKWADATDARNVFAEAIRARGDK
jgi:hypothetical protein